MKKLSKSELRAILTFLIIGLFLALPFFPQTEVHDIPHYDFDDKSYGNFTLSPQGSPHLFLSFKGGKN